MKRFALLAVLVTMLVLGCKKSATQNPVVTDPLAKGINLSNWFNDYSDAAQYAGRFGLTTLQLIKAKGFTYVRIPVGPTILFTPSNPSQLNPAKLAYVDAAIKNCINAGLAVTLNLHPLTNETDSLLSHDAAFVNKLATYWKAVATYFKKYPADKLYFEVYNEPHASAAGITAQNFTWWQPVQGKLIAAIREATPDHYIIAGGEGWNSINGLLQLQPYNDTKLIYNFHFYDPFIFTHQGATWSGWQPAMEARNVPYPSNPAAVAPLIVGSNSTVLNDALQWYGNQRNNIDSLDRWIKRAYDWGQVNHVKIIVNEFGSYKEFSPRQSRLNWIHDVRLTFEKYKIGWCMWNATRALDG
ncbi:MAG: glycoside hydrolase family 5 protein [Chitinophagaceae bacterium]|nr:glycoside hydrolase family 5 protein [Chitinophagaceae bacterium]